MADGHPILSQTPLVRMDVDRSKNDAKTYSLSIRTNMNMLSEILNYTFCPQIRCQTHEPRAVILCPRPNRSPFTLLVYLAHFRLRQGILSIRRQRNQTFLIELRINCLSARTNIYIKTVFPYLEQQTLFFKHTRRVKLSVRR
jgi:hypothetical protein